MREQERRSTLPGCDTPGCEAVAAFVVGAAGAEKNACAKDLGQMVRSASGRRFTIVPVEVLE